MASNRFAAMLHRNTHKIAVILIYTALEWTLILFLLLNSLLFYLIVKFADFFGLKPPCLWCSRLERVLQPTRNENSFRDLICEGHSLEISKLGYCLNHRKLAELRGMCDDCFSSQPLQDREGLQLEFFSLVNDVGMTQTADVTAKEEQIERVLRCSCCGEGLGAGFHSSCSVYKPSWGALNYAQNRNLIKLIGEEDESCNNFRSARFLNPSRSDCPTTDHDDCEIRGEDKVEGKKMPANVSSKRGIIGTEAEVEEEEDPLECSATRFGFDETEGDYEMGSMEFDQDDFGDGSKCLFEEEGPSTIICSSIENECLIQAPSIEDASLQICSSFMDQCPHQDRLFSIELIDSITLNNPYLLKLGKDDEKNSEISENITSTEGIAEVSEEETIFSEMSQANTFSGMLQIKADNIKNSAVFLSEESNDDLAYETRNQTAATLSSQMMTEIGEAKESPEIEKDSDKCIVREQANNLIQGEDFCLELKPVLEIQSANTIGSNDNHHLSSYSEPNEMEEGTQIDKHASYLERMHNLQKFQGEDFCLASKPVPEIRPAEIIGPNINHDSPCCAKPNEMEEERQPETVSSNLESMHNLHRRLPFERKESGTVSPDGSVKSDSEGNEVVTIDRLKSALNAERKALNALYAELEEERSASAIATNQTMAMITRLQEEKAAMQMEALQYQRMMEEQSEYDQEALQLLNELMVKREKEKQDLEKELDLYRKKVLVYESKENRKIKKEKANGTSRSFSAEDSDEEGGDVIEGKGVFFDHKESKQNTPGDQVLGIEKTHKSMKQLSILDEPLDDFEEERLSILEQLKSLEEKLFTMADEEEEEEHFEAIKATHMEENGHESSKNCEICNHHENGTQNGSPEGLEANGVYHNDRRNIYSHARSLLPLFDAISMENEEEALFEEQDDPAFPENNICKFTPENKRLRIEKEVDHVYERLQSLEADREFLKHCVSSLKKGDKGIDLLQEILQHLRELRNMELRVQNSNGNIS